MTRDLFFTLGLGGELTEDAYTKLTAAIEMLIEGDPEAAARFVDMAGEQFVPYYELGSRIAELLSGRPVDGPLQWSIAQVSGSRENPSAKERKKLIKWGWWNATGHMLMGSSPETKREMELARRKRRKEGPPVEVPPLLRGTVHPKLMQLFSKRRR